MGVRSWALRGASGPRRQRAPPWGSPDGAFIRALWSKLSFSGASWRPEGGVSPIGLRLRERLRRAEGRLARTPRRRGDGGGAGARLQRRREAVRRMWARRVEGARAASAHYCWDFPRREAVFGLSGMRPGRIVSSLSGLASSVWSPAASWTPNWACDSPLGASAFFSIGVQAMLPTHGLWFGSGRGVKRVRRAFGTRPARCLRPSCRVLLPFSV